jgi:hypothetical protein
MKGIRNQRLFIILTECSVVLAEFPTDGAEVGILYKGAAILGKSVKWKDEGECRELSARSSPVLVCVTGPKRGTKPGERLRPILDEGEGSLLYEKSPLDLEAAIVLQFGYSRSSRRGLPCRIFQSKEGSVRIRCLNPAASRRASHSGAGRSAKWRAFRTRADMPVPTTI